jgi:hypothetical protein
MTADSALIIFTSLGFASVFLALVIGMAGGNAGEMVAGIASMRPAARRQARFDALDEMTRMADEAVEARRLGKRGPSPFDIRT